MPRDGTTVVHDLDNQMTTPAPPHDAAELRRRWLAVLARADAAALEEALLLAQPLPPAVPLRGPEVGMVMLRARVGGTGDRFNFAEASVARCTMQFPDGRLGVGYVLGRDRRKAELVALLDGALQGEPGQDRLWRAIVEPLARQQARKRDAASRAAAASKVEFFTLVRGES